MQGSQHRVLIACTNLADQGYNYSRINRTGHSNRQKSLAFFQVVPREERPMTVADHCEGAMKQRARGPGHDVISQACIYRKRNWISSGK